MLQAERSGETFLAYKDGHGDLRLMPLAGCERVTMLSYTVEYRTGNEAAFIKVCNPTNETRNDLLTEFNLLVIDAN